MGGRAVVKYDFRLPHLLKGLDISPFRAECGTVGEEGCYLGGPAIAGYPPSGVTRRRDPVLLTGGKGEYEGGLRSYVDRRARRATGTTADLHMLENTGEEDYDRLEFTHCRAFSAQSAIHFDPEPRDLRPHCRCTRPRVLSGADGTSQTVPALLLITVQLTTPITDEHTVGTLIEGKVSGDVLRKGRIVIPNGSIVQGQIRRLERYQNNGGGDFVVGLAFPEVKASGASLRFYADLLRIGSTPGIQPNPSSGTSARRRYPGRRPGSGRDNRSA